MPVGVKNANITKEVFNKVITDVETIYVPIVSAKGGKLVVNRNWDDGTVNAYASRSGNTWNVAMFGGLARHETVTPDGFALVVCHELGHHIGGAPKIRYNTWASNEGQSDYFSSLKCLRRYFEFDDNVAVVAALNVPVAVQKACDEAHPNILDAAICKRSAMAGKSVGDLFVALSRGRAIEFSTPDRTVVTRTNDAHPAAQCRLDTYFAGALCEVDKEEDVSNTNVNTGTCTTANGQKIGLRPLCWYKP
ncbi:MAG: hypothetical protein HQK50_13260 [Oligoflexia bacterium]|nr:hypothetical protein [Oligoflexia bacterium]MBF0366535.1 hypothetical protein [Oligoflexia bacterium]